LPAFAINRWSFSQEKSELQLPKDQISYTFVVGLLSETDPMEATRWAGRQDAAAKLFDEIGYEAATMTAGRGLPAVARKLSGCPVSY
jgi:hypothetical protein